MQLPPSSFNSAAATFAPSQPEPPSSPALAPLRLAPPLPGLGPLHASPPPLPPLSPLCSTVPFDGLFLLYDIVSAAEEAALIHLIDSARPQWRDAVFNGPKRVKEWGVRTDLRRRVGMEPITPLPPTLEAVAQRVRDAAAVAAAAAASTTTTSTTTTITTTTITAAAASLSSWVPNQANAIEYEASRGHFLGAHCDDRQLSGQVLCTLSLGADATMSYTRDRKTQGPSQAAAPVRVRLPRRSVQLQTGDVRFNWRHGIEPADLHGARRVSVTFRCAVVSARHAPS
eukprot:6174601-Pleurochrysis_carterae.AAC.2